MGRYPDTGRRRTTRAAFGVLGAAILAVAGLVLLTGSAMAAPRAPSGVIEVFADVATVQPGSLINYTVNMTNAGPDAEVELVDNLPPHTEVAFAPGCTWHNGGSVNCVYFMVTGQTVTQQITAIVDSRTPCGATLRNAARVNGWDSVDVSVDVVCPAP